MASKQHTKKIKIVTATVMEITEPQFEATYKCPYCGDIGYYSDLDEELIVIETDCLSCKKSFKVKIPRFY